MRIGRRGFLGTTAAAWVALSSGPLPAQPMRLFRIGTGGVAGTYYPVGTLIAAVVGQPPGARPCERGGSCGVPGLLAVVQSSNGSVANIEAILARELESGFAQADIAFWAFHGEGPFLGRAPARDLRAIAKLFTESLHCVVSAESGVRSVADLRGRRVSLAEEGSGTLVDARLVLEAYGLTEADLDAIHLRSDEAVSLMRRGGLDAFFMVAGYPAAAVTEAVRDLNARILPVRGPEAASLVAQHPFLTHDRIPFAVYPRHPAVETIGVGALWLVRADLEEELAYAITRALFHPGSRAVLTSGHPKAREIRPETAIEGLSVPLHAGAERWYREQRLLP